MKKPTTGAPSRGASVICPQQLITNYKKYCLLLSAAAKVIVLAHRKPNHTIRGDIMKGLRSILSLLTVSMTLLHGQTTPPPMPNKAINKLNWIEVVQGRFSTQIMFDFARPVYCRKKVNPDHYQLKLSFPGMTLQQFNEDQVQRSLAKLKTAELIKEIIVQEKNQHIPQVNLIIHFNQTKPAHKNLVLKWSKMEDPFRLILDIFTSDHLKNLEQQSNIILQAHNQGIICDYNDGIMASKKRPAPRIIIDCGHGGDDPGATKFGLKEKEITLDIAEKVRTVLANSGQKALLTRNKDITMSLLERSELAEQLNADLFISIHVNAAAAAHHQHSGIETYFLKQTTRTPHELCGGYFKLGNATQDHVSKLSDLMQQSSNSSLHLARTIQSSLIQGLASNNITCVNRGVKENNSRVLLRSLVPCALVEVGFITHEEEARLLAQQEYRQHIAQGISSGILTYLKTHY